MHVTRLFCPPLNPPEGGVIRVLIPFIAGQWSLPRSPRDPAG